MKMYYKKLDDKRLMVLPKIELKEIMNNDFAFDNSFYERETGDIFIGDGEVFETKEFFHNLIESELNPDLKMNRNEDNEAIEIKGRLVSLKELSKKMICKRIFEIQFKKGMIDKIKV